MPPKRPRIVPSQTDLSVQDVRDYSTPQGAAMANEEMRRLKLAIDNVKEEQEKQRQAALKALEELKPKDDPKPTPVVPEPIVPDPTPVVPPIDPTSGSGDDGKAATPEGIPPDVFFCRASNNHSFEAGDFCVA